MKKIALLLLLAASFFTCRHSAADGAETDQTDLHNLRTSHGKDGDNV